MREIVINSVTKDRGYHVVTLGNGTIHKFNSEKSARKFIADTNRFLNSILFKLNNSLTEVYSHVRELWIITDEIRMRDHAGDKLQALEFYLNQAVIRAPYREGNLFSFINLKKFCEGCKNLIKYLLAIRYVAQTDTHRRHRLDWLFCQVLTIEQELSDYGQSNASGYFTVSRFAQLPFDFSPLKKAA